MKKVIFFYFLCFLGCQPESNSEKIEFIILQLNDVYEIAPLESGKVGGMARVATVRKQLLTENPNVITILSGDFLSPSLIGTLKNQKGNRIKGAQMVDVMNVLGIDYVTFGNHEFDIKEEELLQRIQESKFEWISCNTFHKTDTGVIPFTKYIQDNPVPFPTYVTKEFKTKSGGIVKLGLTGVTLPFNKQDFVVYKDVFKSMQHTYETLQDRSDFVFAITHLELSDDKKLAKALPGIRLILGGHDHVNMHIKEGSSVITKADANAKSVYIHRITYDLKTKDLEIRSELKHIDDKISLDEEVNKVVLKWQNIAHKSMEEMGYNPEAVVTQLKEPLDGRESTIRYKPTPLGKKIAKSFLEADPQADLAVFNSGSVRIDDKIQGAITETDILRILPFGGRIVRITLSGDSLEKLLNTGIKKNIGLGGYLQTIQIEDKNGWFIKGKALEPQTNYQVVLPEFLARGNEQNLEFLKAFPFQKVNTEKTIQTKNDVRNVLIHYLKTQPE